MGEFETRLIRREAWENRPGEAEFAAKSIIAVWAERRKSVYANRPCAVVPTVKVDAGREQPL
jgi:hypothetical protein